MQRNKEDINVHFAQQFVIWHLITSILQALQNVLRLCKALFLGPLARLLDAPEFGIAMCRAFLGHLFGLKERCNSEVTAGAKFQRALFLPT